MPWAVGLFLQCSAMSRHRNASKSLRCLGGNKAKSTALAAPVAETGPRGSRVSLAANHRSFLSWFYVIRSPKAPPTPAAAGRPLEGGGGGALTRWLNQPRAAPADTAELMRSRPPLAPNHAQEVRLHRVESISDLHNGGERGQGGWDRWSGSGEEHGRPCLPS